MRSDGRAVAPTIVRRLQLAAGRGFRMPALGGRALAPRRFTETYYDTRDLRLARARITLRRRVEGGRARWQLVLPPGATRLDSDGIGDAASPPAELGDLLVGHLRRRRLVATVTVRTRRTGLRLRDRRGRLADVVIDVVTAFAGRRPARRFHEIEVALTRDDESALAAIEAVLRDAGATDAGEGPELFAVLGLPPPAPPTPPEPAAPARDHVGAAIRAQLHIVLTHDPGTRLGTDPEALHEMRVATRRLRAYLRVARPMFERVWVDAVRAELAWLGDALGAVRDLDVVLGHLHDEGATLDPPARRAVTRLLAGLEVERATARTALLEALASPRYLALLDRLDGVVRRPKLAEREVTLAELASREFKKLVRAVNDLGDRPSDEALHAVRIRGKRARYAVELAETALGKPATRFLRAAKTFQDILGDHQDAVVAEERLSRLATRVRGARVAFAVGRLAERQRMRRGTARATFASAWKTLRRRGEKVSA